MKNIKVLLLGAVGLPVFSNFNGGIGYLAGAAGGYVFGFLATALIVGTLSKTDTALWLSMTLGVVACYIVGTAWYVFLYGNGKNLWEIALVCIVPFIPGDVLKILAALFTVKRLNRLI